jgi:hypothetical protein
VVSKEKTEKQVNVEEFTVNADDGQNDISASPIIISKVSADSDGIEDF